MVIWSPVSIVLRGAESSVQRNAVEGSSMNFLDCNDFRGLVYVQERCKQAIPVHQDELISVLTHARMYMVIIWFDFFLLKGWNFTQGLSLQSSKFYPDRIRHIGFRVVLIWTFTLGITKFLPNFYPDSLRDFQKFLQFLSAQGSGILGGCRGSYNTTLFLPYSN